jgi:hypothetical protein
MKPRGRDRRSHPRVSITRPLLYQSDIYPKPRMAVTTDLSLGGARIEDASSLYSQESLCLWFSLQPQVITGRGRVVHVQQDGDRFSAGICFESMSEEDRMVLAQYLLNLT